MIGEDHLHTTEKGAIQEKSLVAHRTLMFQPQKKHYQYNSKPFCLKDRTQTIQIRMPRNQIRHPFKENSMVQSIKRLLKWFVLNPDWYI